MVRLTRPNSHATTTDLKGEATAKTICSHRVAHGDRPQTRPHDHEGDPSTNKHVNARPLSRATTPAA
eukprot:2575570-Amphidinium_carterae.1